VLDRKRQRTNPGNRQDLLCRLQRRRDNRLDRSMDELIEVGDKQPVTSKGPEPAQSSQACADHADQPAPRVQVMIGGMSLVAQTDATWNAVQLANDPPRLFRYADRPARVRDQDGEINVETLDAADKFRHELIRLVEFQRSTATNGGTATSEETTPTRDLIHDLLATPNPPLPTLICVTDTPVFGPGGSLQTRPGYDREARTLYRPARGLRLPDVAMTPNVEECQRAKELIVAELMGDFPFRSDADRAHTVALFLQHFVREMIAGPTPLFLVAAPMAGTGKTLLVEAASRPGIDQAFATMPPAGTDDDWRKRITASLATSPPLVFIDNLSTRIDSSSLSAALTGTTWRDRPNFGIETRAFPIRCTWVATGNNPTMSPELRRRTVPIWLDAGMERPSERNEFRHANLRAWIATNRGELVWAALTIVRHWLAAGQPLGQRGLGSYKQWAEVMGGILEAAEIKGFLENLGDAGNAVDDESRAWQEFIQAWHDAFGHEAMGVADLFEIAEQLTDLDLGGDGDNRRVRLGKQLGARRDRVIAGHKLVDAGSQRGARQWKLEPVN
jgi:putative DNA primase/helicase